MREEREKEKTRRETKGEFFLSSRGFSKKKEKKPKNEK